MDLAATARERGEVDGGTAPDPVNTPMVRHWVRAMGDTNPVYLDEQAARRAGHDGLVAPPAMLQVWTMAGYPGPGDDGAAERPGSAVDDLLACFADGGYSGVVATDCEQDFDRYLHPGELLRTTTRFGDLAGPKRTALGTGYFLTWHTSWYSGGERVGTMLFRVLKFLPSAREARAERPADAPAPARPATAEPYPLRPARSCDTHFFWDGALAGELRIQRCADCGRLRHPPGPMCPSCHSTSRDHVVAAGTGTVFSHVVHHHPAVPGRTSPYVVAVVELPEGVRMVGNILGVAPEAVHSGMRVRVDFERVDEDLVLPQWRSAEKPATRDRPPTAGAPALDLAMTRTSIIAQALATRDFQDIHHDPDRARAQGSPDVFMNILTTQGLVERCVTDWAGPAARVRSIAVRLGVPNHAGDTFSLRGTVAERDGPRTTVAVRGTNGIGTHVTGTVVVEVPGPRCGGEESRWR
nr:OB-fold domain-containing protein [Nocardiopsis mwathae]